MKTREIHKLIDENNKATQAHEQMIAEHKQRSELFNAAFQVFIAQQSYLMLGMMYSAVNPNLFNAGSKP